jgi:hypothetical protein
MKTTFQLGISETNKMIGRRLISIKGILYHHLMSPAAMSIANIRLLTNEIPPSKK